MNWNQIGILNLKLDENKAIGLIVHVNSFGAKHRPNIDLVKSKLISFAQSLDTDDIGFLYQSPIKPCHLAGELVAQIVSTPLPRFLDLGRACEESVDFLVSLDEVYKKNLYLITDSYSKSFDSGLNLALSKPISFFICDLGNSSDLEAMTKNKENVCYINSLANNWWK